MVAKKRDESLEEKIEAIEDSVVDSVEEEAVVADKKPAKAALRAQIEKLVGTKKRKRITIAASVLVLVVCVFAIPTSRYFVLSPIIKKDVTLTAIDAQTKKPVTNATIELGGVVAQSDKDGITRLKSVPVGNHKLIVKKQYYKETTQEYTVPVLNSPEASEISIVAAGRQVQISVTNKLTSDAVSNVTLEASGTKTTTNEQGMATIILPPDDEIVKAVIKKEGFNSVEVELKVNETDVNKYSITPSGKIYFLSKSTGKLNVMKSNLDGTDSTTAVQGTGQEADYATTLLSSSDWKYSALSATRTDSKQRLYLIKSQNDDLSVIDQGNASFNIHGWSGHTLIYSVYRNTANPWDDKRIALKSFNAETGKLTVLDETSGSGVSQYQHEYEYLSWVNVYKDEVIFLKGWSFGYYSNNPDKAPTLYTVKFTGGKKALKSFPDSVVYSKFQGPQELFIKAQVNGTTSSTIYKYEAGGLKETSELSNNQFDSNYKTFLVSPSGKRALWYELRDGKNVIQTANSDGSDVKILGNLPEYTPYAWYGEKDDYVLLTKNSELYISSATKALDEAYKPLKITDYQRTQ